MCSWIFFALFFIFIFIQLWYILLQKTPKSAQIKHLPIRTFALLVKDSYLQKVLFK